jgi:hypothetical protein
MFDAASVPEPGSRGGETFARGAGAWGPLRAPPELRVRSCSELKAWLMDPATRKGSLAEYGRGPMLSCTRLVRDYVQTLAAKGFVTAHFMRDGHEGVYVVQRTGTPILTGQL